MTIHTNPPPTFRISIEIAGEKRTVVDLLTLVEARIDIDMAMVGGRHLRIGNPSDSDALRYRNHQI